MQSMCVCTVPDFVNSSSNFKWLVLTFIKLKVRHVEIKKSKQIYEKIIITTTVAMASCRANMTGKPIFWFWRGPEFNDDLICIICISALAAVGRIRHPSAGEPFTSNGTMVKTFQAYLANCHRFYSCVHCRAHLANHDELISKVSFHFVK